jgi:hypothetical protein
MGDADLPVFRAADKDFMKKLRDHEAEPETFELQPYVEQFRANSGRFLERYVGILEPDQLENVFLFKYLSVLVVD